MKLMSIVAEPACFSNERVKTGVDCLEWHILWEGELLIAERRVFSFSLQFLLIILPCTHFLAACDHPMAENFLR
jgi:hypothetical protein